MAYYLVTSWENAQKILAEGFYRGSRFDLHRGEDAWYEYYNYYHLLKSLLPESVYNEIAEEAASGLTWDLEIGKRFGYAILKNCGDDWVIAWMGTDRIFPYYGDTVLEFTPPPDTVMLPNLDFTVAVASLAKFPVNSFALKGFIPGDKDLSDFDTEDGLTLEKASLVDDPILRASSLRWETEARQKK